MYCVVDIGKLLLMHAARGDAWSDPVFMILPVKRLEKMFDDE